MQFQAVTRAFRATTLVAVTSILFWVLTLWCTPSAFALTQVKLSEVTYHECSAELADGTVLSGSAMPASCFIVTGKTQNPSGKPVVNADIFGRIYDANGDSVMQNRTRLGSVDQIPPGAGTFELRISVPANQPTPLKLEQFKAAGFTGLVRR